MAVATWVAAAINLIVAAGAWPLAGTRSACAPDPSPSARDESGPIAHAESAARARLTRLAPIFVAIGMSGFCALASEVIWTRLLALIFSATVYTFSIVLAVFLIGLGLGSGAGAALASRVRSPRTVFVWCQLLAGAAIVWSATMLEASLPYWPVNPSLSSSIWFNFQLDFARALWAILPAPLLWGASFPLALAAAEDALRLHVDSVPPSRFVAATTDTARIVGAVLAANTVGAIAGALAASLVLVAHLGSQHAQQLLVAASIAGVVPLFPRKGYQLGLAGFSVAIATILGLATVIPTVPAVLVAYGRNAASWAGHTGDILYLGEGVHASVAVSRVENGVLNYHNAGKVQASSQPADMRLQRLLGHLTTLVPEHARSVLVIGCGAGVTAGAVSVNPQVEQVTIVDIEPLVPQVARRYFGGVNHDVLRNPKVRVVVDDARHFLATSRERFDAITSDPLDPWVKGAAALYTKEFFDVARAHLNPGGVMTLFVQLYESSPEAVKSEVGTFFDVFPDGMIFGNTFEGRAIDTVLVGPTAPPEIWIDYVDEILRMPAYARVNQSLGEIGVYTATDLFGTYAGRARDLKAWTADAAINRDRNLRLQYLAGFGVNQHEGDAIYRDILQYRAFPDDLFVASESTLWRLKQALEGTRE